MPITSQHIIRQQYLHVELNGTESDGLALQRNLPFVCQHWVTPAIEKVFESCAPADGRHLYIERMEIDVGSLALDRLEQDLAEAVACALEKTLSEQIPPGESSSTAISGGIQHKSAQLSINEAFIFFLKTGSLPWSLRLPAGCTVEQLILDSWQESDKYSTGSRAFIDAVFEVLTLATARKRLVRQFSPVFLKALLSLLSPEGKKMIDRVFEILINSNETLVDTKQFEQYIFEIVFAKVAAGKDIVSMNPVREAWCVLDFAETGNAALANILERHWPGVTKKTPVTDSRINSNEPEQTNNAESMSKNLFVSDKIPFNQDAHPDAPEGIYIENAGLILLHPFLPQFFEALGITTEDKLLQPERALCLLHFLTTGRTAMPEYELVLPKILCNIPLLFPVRSDLELTDPEKEEAVALLEAVIRHWEVLRNTSPDGLRGTFLLRSGKVSMRDDGDWLLQVETKTFDILLDLLPWGVSMIKLPWMENMLWVEWR